MWSWVLGFVLDNIIPIVLTLLLGVLGAKLAHVKTALTTIADALADGKINRQEWAGIRRAVKTIIGR